MFILKKWSEENRRKKDEDYDTSKKEVEKKGNKMNRKEKRR